MDNNHFRNVDFAKEMMNQIENYYGEKIERIVRYKNYGTFFVLTIIFSDYRLLEAEVTVKTFFDFPVIEIQGKIY